MASSPWPDQTRADRTGTGCIPRPLGEELVRLDPWMFWFARPPKDSGFGAAVVVGVTGAFLIQANDATGYLKVGTASASVGDERIGGFLRARRAARKLHYWFSGKNVFLDVEPVICLTRATAAGPRRVRGVTICAREHLATVLARGEQTVAPLHAKKAARALGLSPDAGD
ncbi:MAG: hypothetical protein WD206_08820 [Actinomycetota bacterium]